MHLQDLFERSARPIRARVHLAFGAGVAGAALLLVLPAAFQLSARARVPVRAWAADRDGMRVVGLDGDLIAVSEIAVGWPVAVEARVDGGLWVLRSGNATQTFGMRLTGFDASGVETGETWIEAADTLALADGIDALVVEHGTGAKAADRVLRVAPDGTVRIVAEGDHLDAVASFDGGVLLGTTDGRLLLHEADGSRKLRATIQAAARWGALDATGAPGTFFALDTSSGRKLELRGKDLATRWSVALAIDARALGVVAGEERVWVADASGSRLERYGPGGVKELEITLPQHALDRPLAFGDGALVASPGAVLRVGAAGQPLPGQGGFAWLSDLARVR